MILMVNCSYKASDSNTQFFLELLKEKLEEESRIIPLKKVLNGGFADFLGNWKRPRLWSSARHCMWTVCPPRR